MRNGKCSLLIACGANEQKRRSPRCSGDLRGEFRGKKEKHFWSRRSLISHVAGKPDQARYCMTSGPTEGKKRSLNGVFVPMPKRAGLLQKWFRAPALFGSFLGRLAVQNALEAAARKRIPAYGPMRRVAWEESWQANGGP